LGNYFLRGDFTAMTTIDMLLCLEEGETMKGSISNYKENRWRIRLYWKGQRVQIYRNKRGEILEGKVQAQKAWIHLNQEIEDKIFDLSEWTKEKPFLLKNAFEIFQKAKQCEQEWKYARGRAFKNYIKPQFGDMDIREITTTHVNQFHGHLISKGLKGKTIKNILGVLRSILRFNGIGQKIIWPVIEVQTEPVKWLTRDQQEMIMEYLEEEDRAIFRFLQITGCRPSEACALQRDDIDWSHGIITVRHSMGLRRRVIDHTKTSRIKIIPISVFGEYTSILKPKEVTPFIFSRDGRPYHKQRLQRAWLRTVKKAQQKYPVPSIHVKNAFRHSMASQLINAGVPIEAISKMLGHSSIRMTEKVYANILPETAWGYRKLISFEIKEKANGNS
jgi:integrase